MKRLIKADLYRIIHGKAIYVVFIIMLFSSILAAFGMSPPIVFSIASEPSSVTELEEKKEYDEYFKYLMTMPDDPDINITTIREHMLSFKYFKADKEILSGNLNLYYIIICLAVIIITSDFTSGSYKNAITITSNRKKYYNAKFITTALMTLFIHTVNTFIVCIVNHFINHGKSDSKLSEIAIIYLLHCFPLIGLSSLLVFLAFFFQKTAVFNSVAIPLCIGYQLIIAIPNLLNIRTKLLTRFEMQSIISALAYIRTPDYIIPSLIYCACMIVICYFAGLLYFTRAEIKS